MIIDNGNTTEINQVVEFGYKTPLRGMQTITSLIEDISFESPTRFFNKFFRYSFDGVKFSKYELLTLPALKTAVEIEAGKIPLKNDLLLDFRYVRTGTDITGDLEITEFTVNGIIALEYLQVLDFEDTIFEDIGFTDEYWNKVWINLMRKVYDDGIVPKAMERADPEKDDTDYIVLWKCVAYFYALLVALSENKVIRMSDNEILLSGYLLQRGLVVCGKEDIAILKEFAKNIYDQSRRRGTVAVFEQDGNEFFPVNNPRHGEMLRMVCHNIETDPYHFSYKTGGWLVDSNSPDYNALYEDEQLSKFETGDIPSSFLNLLVDIIGIIDVDIIASGQQVLRFAAGASAETIPFTISSKIGYYIAFYFTIPIGGSIDFDVKGFTADGTDLDLVTVTGAATDTPNNLLDSAVINLDDELVRVVIPIHAFGTPSISLDNAELNIGQGMAQKFKENHSKIALYWKSNIVDIGIWDIRVTPMEQNSECFIDGSPFAKLFLKNTSNRYSELDIKKKIISELAPKNSHLLLKLI